MSADELIQYLSWTVYVLLFVSVMIKAIRRPVRTNIDIALLFALPALLIIFTLATRLGLLPSAANNQSAYAANNRLLIAIVIGLLLALPYMLLRLVDDFADVPTWLVRTSEVALGLFIVVALALP